jgi:hypothetical protein
VLDGSDVNQTVAAPANGTAAQAWDVRSLGNGIFQIVNRGSGRPVSLQGQELAFQLTPSL